MRVGAAKLLTTFLCSTLLLSTWAQGSCSPNTVIVKGRIQNPPLDAKVRVELLYEEQVLGESGDITPESLNFTLQIPFLTQSRAGILIGGLRRKCDRKPITVVVKLLGRSPDSSDQDQEYERISLDFAKDFTKADPTAYALRSPIVLHGAIAIHP